MPSIAETPALAVLALRGDAEAQSPIWLSTSLGSCSPGRGWGDGHTNLVAMNVVIELFKAPLPEHVTITLTMDGKPIAEGSLDRAKLRDVLTLDAPAPGLSGTHQWKVVALGRRFPGSRFLARTARLRSPWQKEAHDGLELALSTAMHGAVGKPTDVAVSAIAPSGVGLHIEQSLPAEIQVDTPSLQALVAAGTIRASTSPTASSSTPRASSFPASCSPATYRVIPALAGTHSRTTASLLQSRHRERRTRHRLHLGRRLTRRTVLTTLTPSPANNYEMTWFVRRTYR